MANAILVINAGSSSIKFSVFLQQGDNLFPEFKGQIEGLNGAPHLSAYTMEGVLLGERSWPKSPRLGHDGAMSALMEMLPEWLRGDRIVAIGHRVVHGGMEFVAPVRLDAATVQKLETLTPLAPLHQPHNLAPIKALLKKMHELPQVACFDTAFHHTQTPVARAFALPQAITEKGVCRYGFHGLSYEYISSVMAQFDIATMGRTVVLHLGNGASMCAIKGGKSVASSMGFTALDGLVMGTRCGSLDPGVILYLMDAYGMDARAIEQLLYRESGLLGVSGISGDMRILEQSTAPQAAAAIDLFVYRIGCELGAMAAALGGLDAIVFTAGIGEYSTLIRHRVCQDAGWLGVVLDESANQENGPRISRGNSKISVWVIPTDEELVIARHTLALIR